jgi:hypothetical protein
MMTIDIEKYKNLFQEIDARFDEIVKELAATRSVLQNDKRFIMTRLLISFSFLEVVCNLYQAYFDLHLGNRALIEEWLSKYCLTDENTTFNSHPYIKMLSAEHLYKFRNSVIHAFALPEAENDIFISVPNGSESSDVIKKMDEGFKKIGHKVAFISADSLLQLFLAGGALMHPTIFKDVTIATQNDLEGLERISGEFIRRGAKGIPLE